MEKYPQSLQAFPALDQVIALFLRDHGPADAAIDL
jgi:hypothetical protein